MSRAIEQHYQPRFAGDALPDGPVAHCVALADKLETLVGIWGIGLQPTGDKDPFALRRHALGVLRMLLEERLPLSTCRAPRRSRRTQFPAGMLGGRHAPTASTPSCSTACAAAARARLHAQRSRSGGRGKSGALDIVIERLDAVQAFAALPEAAALAAANKRITNILKKNGSEAARRRRPRPARSDGAEHDLFMAFQQLEAAGRCRLRRAAISPAR